MENIEMKSTDSLLSSELIDLYQISLHHRNTHGCGGYSFEDVPDCWITWPGFARITRGFRAGLPDTHQTRSQTHIA